MSYLLLKKEEFYIDKISSKDFISLKKILQNERLMLLGWGKVYNDLEVQQWINKIKNQYNNYGYSYFMIKNIDSNEVIGLVRLIPTVINEKECVEIAYVINEEFQGNGFAVASVEILIKHFSDNVKKNTIVAQFVPENINSKKVAENLGMTFAYEYEREMHNGKKKHLVYNFKVY